MSELKTYEGMLEAGYVEILSLPSYTVLQESTNFHTALWYRDNIGRRGNTLVGMYNIPGLAADPEIKIPAGMWREWVRMSGPKYPAPRRRTILPQPPEALAPPRNNRFGHRLFGTMPPPPPQEELATLQEELHPEPQFEWAVGGPDPTTGYNQAAANVPQQVDIRDYARLYTQGTLATTANPLAVTMNDIPVDPADYEPDTERRD